MFNFSNYYQQSQDLPVQNDFQLTPLKWTDAFTFLRETSKCVTVAGLVISASSLVFNFDPTTALTCTAISGVSWLFSRTCVQKLEPQAKEMIKYFKELKEGRHILNKNEAKAFGLIE